METRVMSKLGPVQRNTILPEWTRAMEDEGVCTFIIDGLSEVISVSLLGVGRGTEVGGEEARLVSFSVLFRDQVNFKFRNFAVYWW